MDLLNFQEYPLWINTAAFMLAAGVVWYAGTGLTQYLDEIATRTGISHGYVGLLVLGGITSLPEVGTVSTASAAGNATLATNNLLGSIAINVVRLAIVDALLGRDALTSTVAHPSSLLQGMFNVLLLAVVAIAITTGDIAVFGIGAWSATLIPLFIFSMWMSFKYGSRTPWVAGSRQDQRQHSHQDRNRPRPPSGPGQMGSRDEEDETPLSSLIFRTSFAAGLILAAGYVLAQSADAIATQTGIGASLVGFVLVGFVTGLPELSSIYAAVKLHRYEMAIGDILGSNLWNVVLIVLVDAIYAGGPVLNQSGSFESVAALLGLVLVSIYLIGLLERRDRTILRMGYDSVAVLLTFTAGVIVLWLLARGGG